MGEVIQKAAIIALVNLLFYAKTLCYKYSCDDIPVFMNPPKFKNRWHRIYLWLEGALRINPQYDHALTMLIHTLICVGIYLGFGANTISFIAALLFSFNPTNNQGSVWISGRSYANAALGMTWAFAIPLVAPAFLFMVTHYNAGLPSFLFFASTGNFIMAAVCVVFILIQFNKIKKNVTDKMNMEMFKEDKAIKPQKIILALKTFGFYTTLYIIPFRNTFYHSYLQSLSGSGIARGYTINDRFFWLGLSYILGAGYFLYINGLNHIGSMGIIWWVVFILPFLNILRMQQEISERYTYLPGVGLSLLLASQIYMHPVAVAVFITAYAIRTWFLIDMYQDDYYLVENSCMNDPSAWFAWHMRAMKRWDAGSRMEALTLWVMAWRISPKEFKLNYNLATILIANGRKEEAEKHLKVAEDNIPKGQEEQCNKLLNIWRTQNERPILM